MTEQAFGQHPGASDAPAVEHTVLDSPIGLLTLVTDGTSLTGPGAGSAEPWREAWRDAAGRPAPRHSPAHDERTR